MTQEAINKENADREHEPKQDFIMNAGERHLNRQGNELRKQDTDETGKQIMCGNEAWG